MISDTLKRHAIRDMVYLVPTLGEDSICVSVSIQDILGSKIGSGIVIKPGDANLGGTATVRTIVAGEVYEGVLDWDNTRFCRLRRCEKSVNP